MKPPAKSATAKTKKRAPGAVQPAALREVLTRHIDRVIERELWGRSAGRCEFAGCNRALWKSSVTQERVNLSQKAHIYSFSADGPRGNKGVAKKTINSIANLLLVCHECHQKIDKKKDGGRYAVALLQQWKAQHERRIEIVTGIDPSKKSHVVLYGANVGDHSSPLYFDEAAHALFPRHYPADDRGVLLGTINSSFNDRTPKFWEAEAAHLTSMYTQRVRERLSSGEISHLSIFAIAPQPLLVLLGSLMNNIASADVYQRHREPQTWAWPEKARSLSFTIEEPTSYDARPALVLALSAPVTDDRITTAMGGDAAIWRVTVSRPSMDLIKSRTHLSELRTILRDLLDRIKARHGQTTTLHVFPVAGVSAAIELGRVRMPRAHMPWDVYDQVNALGGFVSALTLSPGQ
jgi:hypothetical protein